MLLDVDTSKIKAAMDALRKGEPLPPTQAPEGWAKLVHLGAWAHLVNSPQFASAINAAICIDRHMARLSAMAGVHDPDQLQRNIGMPRPAYALDDIARAYVTSELRWLVAEVEEYERRLDYACRRYAINGKFDID